MSRMNHEELRGVVASFAEKYGVGPVETERPLSELSWDDSDRQNVVCIYEAGRHRDIKALSWDAFTQHIYRPARYPSSRREQDSVSSPDALLIDRDGIWYFIEFKNCKLNRAKNSVRAKMVEAWHEIMDLLYEMKPEGLGSDFYDDPIGYARRHVVFILVIGEDYPGDVKLIMQSDRAKLKYTPEFMDKLKHYYFLDAYAYTADLLEQRLIRKLA